jgi:hypothetical protein
MADVQTYSGSCHCGRVRYEVATALSPALSCNCSICQKRGSVLTFVPRSAFKLISGENELTDYQFNKKVVHHLFCKTCGIGAFSRGTGPNGEEMIAVNVRCLDNVDLDALSITTFDGKSL